MAKVAEVITINTTVATITPKVRRPCYTVVVANINLEVANTNSPVAITINNIIWTWY